MGKEIITTTQIEIIMIEIIFTKENGIIIKKLMEYITGHHNLMRKLSITN